MVTRDFDAMLAMQAGVRPTFRIGGQVFTVKAKLPNKKFRNLINGFAADDVDEDKATEDFFNLVLIRQDRQRFFDLLNYEGGEDDDDDDENVIAPQQLNELTQWLMEHYTGKVRESSTSSSSGYDGTGASPKVVSLNSRTAASA